MTSRVVTRVLLSVLAGALCGVVATSAVVLTRPAERVDLALPEVALARSSPTPAAAGRAREVLRSWDEDRAAAWTAGDDARLAMLYTPGSVAGERDVAMLRAWTARGARVSDLTTQVLGLQVLVERADRLVLVVTDRVARVRAAGVVLADDRPSTRRIVLLRGASGWRVASVGADQS